MTQVIELTSKKLKLHQVFAALAACLGVVFTVVAFNGGHPIYLTAGTILFAGSLVWFFVVRILIWWFHK